MYVSEGEKDIDFVNVREGGREGEIYNVCVIEREREREEKKERKRGRKKERYRERERECVFVCVCLKLFKEWERDGGAGGRKDHENLKY